MSCTLGSSICWGGCAAVKEVKVSVGWDWDGQVVDVNESEGSWGCAEKVQVGKIKDKAELAGPVSEFGGGKEWLWRGRFGGIEGDCWEETAGIGELVVTDWGFFLLCSARPPFRPRPLGMSVIANFETLDSFFDFLLQKTNCGNLWLTSATATLWEQMPKDWTQVWLCEIHWM